MEAAGVALALLPLMLNQLDSYVEGLQTLKTFRANRYRAYLERYAAMLGGQHAILMNTLCRALSDLPVAEIRDLLSSPDSIHWTNPRLEDVLRPSLGSDYQVFVAMMKQASQILEELATRLNWKASDPTVLPWRDPNIIVREAQKIKRICSKSIFKDLSNSLDSANNILKTLVDQSVENKYHQRHLRLNPASKYRVARKAAGNVHRALIHGQCWDCACREKHRIRFVLDPSFDVGADIGEYFFRIIVTTPGSECAAQVSMHWQEMDIQPSHHWASHSTLSAPLSDMCSALWSVDVKEGQREMIGYLADSSYRYNTFLIKRAMGYFPSKTLEEIITSSPSFPWHAHPVDRPVFHRRTRLQLAAKLAHSVLHFHGSWLQAHWSSRDIRFPDGAPGLQQPFLTWSILNLQEKAPCQRSSVSIVGNETLFPLGLALVELSLCRTIAALQVPEDENPDEEVTALRTARRYLDNVYSESGITYGDVVQQCLFWSHTRNATMDDEDFQAAVFEHVVQPLLDDVKDFDGSKDVN